MPTTLYSLVILYECYTACLICPSPRPHAPGPLLEDDGQGRPRAEHFTLRLLWLTPTLGSAYQYISFTEGTCSTKRCLSRSTEGLKSHVMKSPGFPTPGPWPCWVFLIKYTSFCLTHSSLTFVLFINNSVFYFIPIVFNIYFYLFLYLAVPGLSCGLWDLVPWPGLTPRSAALGEQCLSHWTTRKVPNNSVFS